MPSDRPKDRWNMDRGKLFMKSSYVELKAAGTDEHPACLLHGTVTIGGIDFHAEAIQVVKKDGIQQPANPDWRFELDSLYQASGAQEPFQTLFIDGRDYVLHVFPHS